MQQNIQSDQPDKTAEEKQQELAQVLDRQSFIGYEVQQRLLKSNVLIVGLTGCNTELTKNLILSGAGVTIFDDGNVNERDAETNFLFGKADIGQRRGELGTAKFKEINPLVSIEQLNSLDLAQLYQSVVLGEGDPSIDIKKFDVVSTSTSDFSVSEKWDAICYKLNVPYYNLVCCGLYGFYYVNLGNKQHFQKQKQQNIQIQNGKSEPQYKEFEEITMNCYQQKEALKLDHKTPRNEIYYCILMVAQAQEKLNWRDFDPFDVSAENQAKVDQVVKLGEEIWQSALQRPPNDEQKLLLRNFARLFGVSFCPVYSVIGSVAAQEFIVVISRQNEPGVNWFCYDSQAGYGLIECVQKPEEFERRDLPERRQLIVNE